MANFSVNTPFGGGSGYDPFNSVLEVGVNNLVGNYFSGLVGSYFGSKSSKKAAKYQKLLAKWQALNMPTLQKEGLIKAGYNPLLAVMQGGHFGQLPSAYNAFHSMPNLGSSSVGGASVTPYEGKRKMQEAKTAESLTKMTDAQSKGVVIDNSIKAQQLRKETAEASVAEDESSARQVQAYVAEVEALATLDALGASVNREVKPSLDSVSWNPRSARGVYTDKKYDRLVEKIKNAVDWDVKSKSNENFWWRRGLEAVHGLREASSAYDSYRGSRKIIHGK